MVEKDVIYKKDIDRYMESINDYIDFYAANPFKNHEVGRILEDAVSSRGKMIRPKLLLQSAAFGPDFYTKKEKICKLAAMVELTHMASLIHDDIVDDAPSRRGEPSIQQKYGKNAAVYAGDFLMSRISYHVAAEEMTQSGAILAKTVEEMCIGEIGQSCCRYRDDTSIEDYMRNIHGKTAALFVAACHIGASESGCDDQVIKNLEMLAEYAGIMFQLRDDLLDFTSNSKLMGKATHKDFRDGIYTLPVLLTLQNVKGREELMPFLKANKERKLSDYELEQMEHIVKKYDGVESVRKQIFHLGKQAEELLEKNLPQVQPGKDLLFMIHKLERNL